MSKKYEGFMTSDNTAMVSCINESMSIRGSYNDGTLIEITKKQAMDFFDLDDKHTDKKCDECNDTCETGDGLITEGKRKICRNCYNDLDFYT